MIKIETLRDRKFQNALHVQCITEVIELTRVNNPLAMKVKPQYDGLITAFELEDEAFRYMRKDEFTALKVEKDGERDVVCTGLLDAVKAAEHHYEPTIAAAARRIQLVLDSFNRPIPIIKQSYDAETASITNLLQELARKEDDVHQLGISGWVELLDTKNREFELIARQATGHQVEKPTVNMRKARANASKALHLLFKCVNALILIDGEEAYVHYVPALNALIRHYNDVAARHLGTVHHKDD